MGSQIFKSIPIIHHIDNVNVTHARITLKTPALMYTDGDGDVHGQSVHFTIEVSSDGGAYIQYGAGLNISGLIRSAYQRSYLLDLHGIPPWDIKDPA